MFHILTEFAGLEWKSEWGNGSSMKANHTDDFIIKILWHNSGFHPPRKVCDSTNLYHIIIIENKINKLVVILSSLEKKKKKISQTSHHDIQPFFLFIIIRIYWKYTKIHHIRLSSIQDQITSKTEKKNTESLKRFQKTKIILTYPNNIY